MARTYPAEYIDEKLAMAQELAATGSCTNPAGWLRKAVEEYYSPTKIREKKNREKKAQQAMRIVEEPAPDPEPTSDPEPTLEEDHQKEE
jgi:hypothetical protein